jgi:hypothetical protein
LPPEEIGLQVWTTGTLSLGFKWSRPSVMQAEAFGETVRQGCH